MEIFYVAEICVNRIIAIFQLETFSVPRAAKYYNESIGPLENVSMRIYKIPVDFRKFQELYTVSGKKEPIVFEA